MSWSTRRAILVLIAAVSLALATSLPQALARKALLKKQPALPVAQVPGVPGNPTLSEPGDLNDNISLPKDNTRKGQIEAAYDYIKVEDWVEAAGILQKLVDLPEDVFIQLTRKAPDGKETKVWTSVKSEANRLIASLPPKGLDYYKTNFGATAAAMLKEARATGDMDKLRQVMSRFLHTDAGADATNLLGTYHLDKGNYVIASLCFERLFNREGLAKLVPTTLFKAAYAFHQAGDKANEDRAWKELHTRGQNIALGQERKSVTELQDYVASLPLGSVQLSQNDWPLFAGNASRNGRGEGDTPFMDPRWKKDTVRQATTRSWLEQAITFTNNRKQPLLPAAVPITATITKDGRRVPLVIYRSHWGIHAVKAKSGETFWETPSSWSLDRMVADGHKASAVTNWVNFYQQNNRPTVLLENSTTGTLSTDSNFAYVVEDLAVPPPPQFANADFGGQFNPGVGRFGTSITDAVLHSRLQAFDLATGKLKWELGARSKPDKKVGELEDTYFLGPPIPVGGKLYVLTEKQQELRLACIDPLVKGEGLAPKVVSIQTLATTRDKLEVGRRMQAAHLSYGEGMLVCPTNAGALLAVDLLSNRLVWAYPYRAKNSTPAEQPIDPRLGRRIRPGFIGPDGMPINMAQNPHWHVTAPIIQDGLVVFTAPDSKAVHCIKLRDGSFVWKHERQESDLFLGGVQNGKVLVVGKNTVRALSLAKGDVAWSVEVGMPSGLGVASDNLYYLPIKEAASGKEPEICAIDVERGIVHAHTKSRKKDVVPGNLIFYDGDVLSQTAMEVVSFPQLKAKLAQIDDLITKNPNDPVGLTERGDLRLDKGDLQGAIDDLSRALKNSPPKDLLHRTKTKLYETLTELFKRDFNAAEKHLKEYEDLCTVDVEGATTDTEKLERQNESRRRRADFLCLVAKGKENQRKLVEAFEKYMEFSTLAKKDELLSVIDEPSVKAAPDVWSQGRIRAMIDSATPEERKPLEEKIAARWDQIKKGNSPDQVRDFVAVFGSLFSVGKEARLHLAEMLLKDSDPMALLEAERHLSLLRGKTEEPRVAARAVECLARLNTQKNHLKDAAYYYRLLGREYNNVDLGDGRTGGDIYNDLATDKRLLPHLGDPAPPLIRKKPDGRYDWEAEGGNFPFQHQTYRFGQVGERLPYFEDHKLVLRFDSHGLKIVERGKEDEDTPSIPLTRTFFQNMVYGNGQPNMTQFSFMNLGHLVVLPVGHMVFGIDPINRKVLWEKDLHAQQNMTPGAAAQGQPPQHNQLVVDRDGTVLVTYPDGWTQRLGGHGPLEGNVICLQTRDALIGIDPVTGRTLWTRSDVSPRNHIFGDDQTIYVVEMSAEGKASGTRALRAYDGVSVKVPDFSAAYEKRVGQSGRRLLVSEQAQPGAATTLRIYDVATGQDLWKESFAAGSVQLHSEDPNLAGMFEPEGRVRAVNIATAKEVLNGKVNPQHFAGVTSLHLLADRQYYYVAANGPVNAQLMPFGGVQMNLMAGTGLRALPVNGWVYSFTASTGKINWFYQFENQMIVLEQFADLPMVLCTARYQKWTQNGPGRNVTQVVAVKSRAKSNGKLIIEKEDINTGSNFHDLRVDNRARKIEFIGHQTKITFFMEGAAK